LPAVEKNAVSKTITEPVTSTESSAKLANDVPLTKTLNQNQEVLQNEQPSTEPADSEAISEHESVDDKPISTNVEEQLQTLKLQSAILFVQQLIQLKHYQKELVILKQEKTKWQLQNELRQERTLDELAQLDAEKKKLLLENQLYAARQKQQLAELNEMKIRLELENQVHEQEKKKLLRQLEQERSQLAIQNAIEEEKNKQKTLQLQLNTAQLEFERAKLEFEKNQRDLETAELTDKISAREQQEVWESQVNKPIKYLPNPIVNGFLILTDRQIKLNDIIYPGTADYVAERIYYFNNKTEEYPIFLIFDTCYGGSVMEGARILEAMLNSRAPVYVVVKSLAASMAAVITTMAKHSYAYPHAIILHHQIVLEDYGGSNQREIEEKFQMASAWSKRIMQPIVEKMGISLDQFTKMMYEKNSQGNWYEFAEEAVQMKWVEQVVKGVRDVSVIKQPSNEEETIVVEEQSEPEQQVDAQGRHYKPLPPLAPLDFYYLYNPNKYYR
jgi:ATP-dependent Clp protease protease subunit